MIITKSKSYNGISLNEIKTHLKIADGDDSYNGELTMIMQTAIAEAEAITNRSFALSSNVLEDYCISGNYYQLPEPNVNVVGITGITDTTSTIITGYAIYKYYNYTRIKFNQPVQADKLLIAYSSGYPQIPVEIKHAIKLKVAEYFDIDRQNYTPNNIQRSDAFIRLLSAYILIA